MPHNNDDARIIVPSSQSLVSMNRLIHRNNPIVDLILILEVCSVYMQRNYLRQIALETLGISFLSFQSLLEKLLSTFPYSPKMSVHFAYNVCSLYY